jgi:hypothetical protein
MISEWWLDTIGKNYKRAGIIEVNLVDKFLGLWLLA